MVKSHNHGVGRTTFGAHDHEIRTAVILAAGMGVRLKERGKLTPKGCMRLGEKSIVEESVLRLLGVGIQRIVIVTGHLAEQFEHLQRQYRETVQLVHNPHFADSGSMYSLYCARHCVNEAFLLLESDLVYERRALTSCLEHRSDNVVLLSGFSKSSDEVFAETRDGCLVEMSKHRECLGAEISGEFVGVCKISRPLFAVMIDAATKRFGATRHMDYETDCLVAAARLTRVSCSVVEDLIWCEIDDESHHARARSQIYPAVRAADVLDGLRFSGRTTASPQAVIGHREAIDAQGGRRPISTKFERDTCNPNRLGKSSGMNDGQREQQP